MSERDIFPVLLAGWFVLAAGTFVGLFFFTAPYGRYSRRNWGPKVGDALGWVLMEASAPAVFAACFALGRFSFAGCLPVIFAIWEAHYIHRSFIYPFMLRGREKRMPLVVALAGFFFNGVNAYMNGRFLFNFSGGFPMVWLASPPFIAGFALFVAGFVVNRWADLKLRSLRAPGESDYKIPHGGLYRYVSCPNYLGEIMEWVGWAVLTWSLAGASFAVWTAANLVPRARANHAWYRRTFPDYPAGRKALVPFVW